MRQDTYPRATFDLGKIRRETPGSFIVTTHPDEIMVTHDFAAHHPKSDWIHPVLFGDATTFDCYLPTLDVGAPDVTYWYELSDDDREKSRIVHSNHVFGLLVEYGNGKFQQQLLENARESAMLEALFEQTTTHIVQYLDNDVETGVCYVIPNDKKRLDAAIEQLVQDRGATFDRIQLETFSAQANGTLRTIKRHLNELAPYSSHTDQEDSP